MSSVHTRSSSGSFFSSPALVTDRQRLIEDLSSIREEFDKLKKEKSYLEETIVYHKLQWAEENNFLRGELSRAESAAIAAKLQAAQLATDNDTLEFKLMKAMKLLEEGKKRKFSSIFSRK